MTPVSCVFRLWRALLVSVFLSAWAVLPAQASLTLYHGPHEDFMIKTQIASGQPLSILVLQERWVLVQSQRDGTQGWTTLPALYNNGYLTHPAYLRYKQQQADRWGADLEWFWQSEQAFGVGVRLPFDQWLSERWPKTAAEVLALWPGDQQNWILRYHRGNQGESAWHSLQTGFESRITQWHGWSSHAYVGGGLGINELLSTHWDDVGASRTVPLVAGAMDIRYALLPRLDMALRFEASQALGADGGNTAALHRAVSLVWVLDL